jgi:molybdenum cofactor biosynthesis enzyme MoaA
MKINIWKPFKIKPLKRISPVKLNMINYPKRSKVELRLIDLKPFGDKDKDGVMNWFDCKPLNRKMQGGKSTEAWRRQRKEYITKAEKYFKGKRGGHHYTSKYILPSGKIITVGLPNFI